MGEDCIFKDGKYAKPTRQSSVSILTRSAGTIVCGKFLRVGRSRDQQPWFKKTYGPNLTTVVASAVAREQSRMRCRGMSPKTAGINPHHLASAVASEQRRLSCTDWSPESANAAIRRVYQKSIRFRSFAEGTAGSKKPSLPGDPPIEINILPPLPDTVESDSDSGCDSMSSIFSDDDDESNSSRRSERLSVHSLPSESTVGHSEQDHYQLGCGWPEVPEPMARPPELLNSEKHIRPVSNSGSDQLSSQLRNLQIQLELMKIQVAIIQLLALIFIVWTLLYKTCYATPVRGQSRPLLLILSSTIQMA